MKILQKTKNASYLILIFSILSCVSNKQVTAKEPILKEATTAIIKPKILFLNYVLVKDVDQKKSISLMNKINTEGKLKGKPKKVENVTVGDLEYSVLDTDLNEIEKHAIKNPLIKTVEFVNDFGNFEKRVLDLDNVQFTIRMQLPPKALYIVIKELTSTAPIELISTKID